jgi:tetratricopeptide (TPR) repeat protein
VLNLLIGVVADAKFATKLEEPAVSSSATDEGVDGPPPIASAQSSPATPTRPDGEKNDTRAISAESAPTETQNEAASAASAPVQPKAKGSPPRTLSRRRKWLFRLAAVVLGPAVLFAILELSLRVGGYGYSTSFFLDGTEIEGKDVWIENPDYNRRFFPRSLAEVPQPIPFVLPKKKEEGTFRIFVLGESAAMGYPDPSMSFARIMEAMLRIRYPAIRFEVINTSMVAINSHVVLQVARECAEQQPDLLVVFVGNNEIVGPYGAAGVLGPFSPNLTAIRANFAIKRTRTGQLLSRIVNGSPQASQDWQGMTMFTNCQLRAKDGRLPGIYAHFRENLKEICRAGADAGAPVVLCTVPVNLKDCAPFASMHAEALNQDSAKIWEEFFRQGVRLQNDKNLAAALRFYKQASEIDDDFAELTYREAQCFASLGDTSQADRLYKQARDQDCLRFRADSKINGIIRETAVAHAGTGVKLADVEREFEKNSPGACPGEEFFLEHVHMNFRGNHLAAQVICEVIADVAPARLGQPAGDLSTKLSQSACAKRLAYTEWHELKIGKQIHGLMLKPPFTLQFDHDELCARGQTKLNGLRARFDAEAKKQAVAAHQDALEIAPEDWMIRANLSLLLDECGMRADAKMQAEQIIVQMKHNFNIRCRIGDLAVRMGLPLEAESDFREALKLRPDDMGASLGLASALEGQGKGAEAFSLIDEQVRKNPNNALALSSLGRIHYRQGNMLEAEARFAQALKQEPTNPQLHFELGMTELKQDKLNEAIEHFQNALRLQPDWRDVEALLADLRKKSDRGN